MPRRLFFLNCLIALSVFSGVPAFARTAPVWDVYCLLVQTGTSPSVDFTLNYGDKKEAFVDKNYHYSVEYGGLNGQILLTAENSLTGKQSVAATSADPLPSEVTLVVEGTGRPFACFRK